MLRARGSTPTGVSAAVDEEDVEKGCAVAGEDDVVKKPPAPRRVLAIDIIVCCCPPTTRDAADAALFVNPPPTRKRASAGQARRDAEDIAAADAWMKNPLKKKYTLFVLIGFYFDFFLSIAKKSLFTKAVLLDCGRATL